MQVDLHILLIAGCMLNVLGFLRGRRSRDYEVANLRRVVGELCIGIIRVVPDDDGELHAQIADDDDDLDLRLLRDGDAWKD